MTKRPNVLIENWLPFEELGIESQREHQYGSPYPALNRIHVWWARRPLLASRGAVLAGLLPQWDDSDKRLTVQFENQSQYYDWVIKLLGIRGNPREAKKLIAWSKLTGNKLSENPYSATRAFEINPDPEDLKILHDLLKNVWGSDQVSVLDITSGGGSIPFEALRYGFKTYANELNPVASLILRATLEFPAIYGNDLKPEIVKWGKQWIDVVQKRLAPFYPKENNENIFGYVWARTVKCPTTGKPVPLTPNWWLKSGTTSVAVKLITKPDWQTPRFEIQWNDAIDFNPDIGTIKRGIGISPWTGEIIEGNYIKSEAQAGNMGAMLYAIAIKESRRTTFRAPTEKDYDAISRAEAELSKLLPRWLSEGIIPDEAIPTGNKTAEPQRYGFYSWNDMFAPRQLLALGTYVETLNDLIDQMKSEMDPELVSSVTTYLAFMIDKSVDRNSYQTRWIPRRSAIANTFDRHDFAMKWSFGEFDGSANLLQWAFEQIEGVYSDLVDLLAPTQYPLWGESSHKPTDNLHILQGSATSVSIIEDNTIHNITFDPPYYDNVMYAELSDFFYVWLKRSVGQLFPESFNDHLVNKEDEAVANVARFSAMGKKKKQLAEKDYERKMEAIFRECHRVLRDDGVLTIMFTHKKVEAWDTLASALINAGFTVKASWPVHTEYEHSLHQAKKNAAASTIFLACRKREDSGEPVWWEDIRGKVRRIAREKAEEFAAQGIGGVDLYISTFGPALSVISEQWPVLTSEVDEKTGEPLPLRPETALDLAREEVVSLRKQGLLLGRDIEFDAITDWYLMAWDAFAAEEFPYDEARKLAIALGVDLDGDIRGKKNIVTKKSSSVVIQTPKQRRKRGMVDPEVEVFDSLIDAVHTAMLVLQEDGANACEVFLNRSGLMSDGAFKQCVQAMINAIPRTKIKKKWARIEAELLEGLRLNFFLDLSVPVEEELPNLPTQLNLFDSKDAPDEDDMDEDETDEGEDDE
jgi:putative DNA methylase